RRQDDSGHVTYTSMSFQEEAMVLLCLVEMNDDIPDTERLNIAGKALWTPTRSGEALDVCLLRAMDESLLEYYRHPLQNLVVLSTISISPLATLATVTDAAGVVITFPPVLAQGMYKAREHAIKEIVPHDFPNTANGYRWVSVATAARTPAGAIQTAVE